MSNSIKKKTITIRYLLAGTMESLHEAVIEDKTKFSLKDHAADLVAKGYEVLESDLPKGTDKNALVKKNYTVYLRERVSIVRPDQPKTEGEVVKGHKGLFWPAGLEDFDLRVTRSRRIRYQYLDGEKALPTVSEIIEFERSAMVNHVTAQVTYMPWQAIGEGEFAAVKTPKLSGYKADILVVEAVEDLDLETSQDQEIVVTFTKEPQFATIEIMDLDSGNLLFTEELEGEQDQEIDYPMATVLDQYKAKGYELVTNPFEEIQRFGQGETKNPTYRFEVKAKVVLVHDGELPEVGEPVYPELENSVVWPQGVRESKLRRQVTRTIVNQHENGQVIETIEQLVSFRRPAKINLLTQEVSYADWELVSDQASFPAYVPEELSGYAPRPRKLPELAPVTADSANLKEVITYTRQIQRVTLRFVDRSQGDLVLYQSQLVGKTGERIRFDHKKKIQEFLNIGYEVVANDFPAEATFTAEVTEQEVYTIALEPKTLVVSSSDPKVAGRFIDEKALNGPKWPVGVDKQDLRHLVTRTVHYRYDNGKSAANSHVDHILFERQAEINLVTSQVTYTPWTSKETAFAEHEVPRIDGYYATRDTIPGIEDITVTSADFEVSVYYIKTSNQINYTIVDKTTGQTLETKLVNGRSVQKLREEIERKLQPYLAKGYQLENAQRLNLALKNPETSALTIELSQQVRDITADQPKQAHGLVDGYSQLNWPSGLEEEQLTRTITRQVRLLYANGEEISGQIDQSVTFTRSAQINLVTAEVTYGEWEAKQSVFPALELPELEGYLPSQTLLPEEEVLADQLNRLIEVVYHQEPAQVVVVYLEEGSDKELYRDVFSAPAGETFDYQVENRLPLIDLTAYEVLTSDCPNSLQFGEKDQTYTVTLRPKTLLVTADEPHQAGTTSWLDGYGLFNWPVGLDKESLVGEVHRVITYKDELGQLLLDDKLEQKARFTRSAMLNLATKEVTYQPWSNEVASLEAVQNPEFEGLLPSLTEVPVLDLTDSDALINRVLEVTVTYSQQPYRAHFKFNDSLRQELLGEVNLTVLEKQAVREAYQELLETYQQLGYIEADNQELDLSEWTLEAPKVFEISLKPQLMTVSIDHIDEQFESFDEEVASQLQVLEGLSRLDLTRQVNRTIKYLYTNGKTVSSAYTDSITFKRSARVNLATGEIFYDDWTSYYPVFDEVLSPVIDDYTPSKETVEAIEHVTADSQDMVETIIYTRKIQQVVVSVVDKATGNIIYAESITGTNGVADTSYEVSKFVKKGQDFVSDDIKPVSTPRVEEKTKVSQPVEAKLLQEEAKPVKKPSVLKQALSVGKKAEAKEVIIGVKDDKLQKVHGLTADDLTKTVTRHVRFVDDKGKELDETVTQQVTYQRQAKVTDKSKPVNFTDWQVVGESKFPEVTSPKLEGVEPDKERVPAVTPDPEGASEHHDQVLYTPVKKPTNISIVFVDQDTDEDIMNFTFVDRGRDYTEKKLKKGESFLDYKGYEIVSTTYPDKGELLSEDTVLYQITVRQKDQSRSTKESDEGEEAATSRKLRESINKKPSLGESTLSKTTFDISKDNERVNLQSKESKEGKQKGLFNFLFKD